MFVFLLLTMERTANVWLARGNFGWRDGLRAFHGLNDPELLLCSGLRLFVDLLSAVLWTAGGAKTLSGHVEIATGGTPVAFRCLPDSTYREARGGREATEPDSHGGEYRVCKAERTGLQREGPDLSREEHEVVGPAGNRAALVLSPMENEPYQHQRGRDIETGRDTKRRVETNGDKTMR